MRGKASAHLWRNGSRSGEIDKGCEKRNRGIGEKGKGDTGDCEKELGKVKNNKTLPKLSALLLALAVAGSTTVLAKITTALLVAPRSQTRVDNAVVLRSEFPRPVMPVNPCPLRRANSLSAPSKLPAMSGARDPKGSVPIDEMQGRPSLPVRSAEAIAGSERAQRLLPLAKDLVIESLGRLASEYKLSSRSSRLKLQQALQRVRMVRRIKPDMDSRDNASVLMRNPVTITFGTIFLAGLPSDEAMISVLGHELVHIADGDHDALLALYRAIGKRASGLTGLDIRAQRAEELTCDLVGALAAREFVADTPDYVPLARRVSRAVAHNCVEEDEGDEDHLSPRNTIRALLSLNPALTRELVYGSN